MALRRAFALRHEVHLQIGEVRSAPQKVVPHEAVEVVGRRHAHVLLDVDDRLIVQGGRRQRRRDARRRLERRALGHVDHDLELALVVERHHLHRHQFERDQRDGRQQQHRHARQEDRAPPAAGDERPHHAAIEPREEIFFAVIVMRGGLEQPDRGPRRHDEGDHQREDHRRRRAHRNRPHVGPRQSADERHRQDRRHHRECREDRGVAHFVNGANRDRGQPAPLLAAHPRVADDVLHHDDRIVHQDADGEDQREERDAVQGVAIEIEHEQRERERDRNRDQHDGRLAPAEDQPDQRRDREDGEQHVPQQFVALVGGGLAIVAGDGEMHVRRHERSLERVELLGDAVGDVGGVGALPLGDGDGDGRLRAGRLRLEGDIRRGLGVAVHHFRHVAHEHGTPAGRRSRRCCAVHRLCAGGSPPRGRSSTPPATGPDAVPRTLVRAIAC